MIRLLFALALLLGLGDAALSQALVRPCITTGPAGSPCTPVSAANPLPVDAAVAVSGFTPASTGTPIVADTNGETGSLPAGAVVVASNVGTANVAYCKLGASATVADQPITPNGGWFAFTVGVATQLTCITSTSTTTVNMVGGAGLPTGTGGGGGGSGGGAVTIADGADATQGAIADAAATAGGTGTVAAKLRLMSSQLDTIASSVAGAIPTGANVIGQVSVNQTTPGTTNAVQTIPGTTGGLSWYFVQPAASDNHVVIKAGAGMVFNIHATNISATVNYIRLYNATTGFNGCNSATNIVGQWAIPASTSVGGIALSIPQGIAFSTGISICVTSGYATTDTTNATASSMSVNVGYK